MDRLVVIGQKITRLLLGQTLLDQSPEYSKSVEALFCPITIKNSTGICDLLCKRCHKTNLSTEGICRLCVKVRSVDSIYDMPLE